MYAYNTVFLVMLRTRGAQQKNLMDALQLPITPIWEYSI